MSDFKAVQFGFAAHIRDPKTNAGPENIEPRRLKIYSDLFFNNVEGFIASGFPVLRSLYGDDDWQSLIRDYFSRHRARTPHFPEMAQEFVDYLQTEFSPRDCDPPFILELAHYEWMETAVMLSTDDISDVQFDEDGDLLEGQVVISPVAWMLSYQWPVHELSPDYQPQTIPDEPTWIIIYRDKADAVGFMQINPVTARLFEILDQDDPPVSGREALEQVAGELNHAQPEAIVQGGLDTLRQLRKKDIVLGTRP